MMFPKSMPGVGNQLRLPPRLSCLLEIRNLVSREPGIRTSHLNRGHHLNPVDRDLIQEGSPDKAPDRQTRSSNRNSSNKIQTNSSSVNFLSSSKETSNRNCGAGGTPAPQNRRPF